MNPLDDPALHTTRLDRTPTLPLHPGCHACTWIAARFAKLHDCVGELTMLRPSRFRTRDLPDGQQEDHTVTQTKHDTVDLEALSARLHEIYQKEAHRRGDVRHADAYADLPELTKEWDRVLARWVLAHWTPTFDPAQGLPDP